MRTPRLFVLITFLSFQLQKLSAQNLGINVSDPQYPVHIEQHDTATLENYDAVLYAEYTATDANVIAIKSKSTPADGVGIGGYFEGGYIGAAGVANGEGDQVYAGIAGITEGVGSGIFYGVLGQAYGAGENYAIAGAASGGTKNLAGYFIGDASITDRLGIGTDEPVYGIDMSKTQAVTRMTTENHVNGAVLDLRNLTASPTYVGAINFSVEAGTAAQIGYLGTNNFAFRIGQVERMRIGFYNIGMFNSNPQHPIHINQPSGTTLSGTQPVMHVEYTGTNTADVIGVRAKCRPADYYGIGGEFEGGYIGTKGKVNATGNQSYYGVYGEVTGDATGTKYAVYGSATGTGTTWAGYFAGNLYSQKVGIGRAPVTNLLEVEGTASKSSAGDWVANSDARLKKNIQALDAGETIHKLLSLQGITYEWNDDKTGSKRPEGIQYGFTAQNIQEVYPTLVEEDALGYLQTAYSTYDAMIIEAIRYLYNENQQLKEQVAALLETVRP